MSEYRQLHRSFWESGSVETMDPVEKLLYCYLITSPASNMEGLYKTTLRRIAFETGVDKDMVVQLCQRLEDKQLAGFNDGWVCVTQATKHMADSPKMITHAERVYTEAGEDVMKWALSLGYLIPNRVSIPYPTRLDNTRQDETSLAKAPKTIAPLKDDLAARWEAAFVAKVPMSAWGDIGRGRRDCGVLAKKLRALSKDTGIDETALASSLIASFLTLKSRGKADFWRTATFTPTGFLARWAEVVDETAKENSKPEMDESTKVFLEGVYAKRD